MNDISNEMLQRKITMDNFLLYRSATGDVRVEVLLQEETLWLTQKAIADLFQVGVPAITKHIQNIYETGELSEMATVSKMETVRQEGKRTVKRELTYYNLDMIIAVGYRVNSIQATQFRMWATKTLKEYIVKGFVLDDERLKQGQQLFGKDYFDELLERIREIRASERRFYQKIADIYALSADYDKEAQETREFFASVQNTLHWAITGKTAAEMIYNEADAARLHMGLKTWKYAPDGKILKSDVTVAKNYMSEQHISELNRIVSAYLDLAENYAQRGIVMRMKDWKGFLGNFLKLANYPVLMNKGKISALKAKLKAESEFEKFRTVQDKSYESDFDKEVKRLKEK
jgi:hypothetical protein